MQSTPLKMNLFSLKTIKLLLQQYQVHPKKRLGQNFLTNKGALDKILETADLSPQDTVVEIGPGIGTLTLALAQKAKRVIAVEKDPKMVEILKETLVGYKNIELIHGDILGIVLNQVKHKPRIVPTRYKLISNLPYYITSPVIRKFLEAQHKPKLMILMVQKEVAQRICSKPPNMSLLAVSVQFYGEPKIVSYVKRTSFWPQPSVDSAILRINTCPERSRRATEFFKIVKAGFKQPRKQLLHNLVHELPLMLDARRLTTSEKRVWIEQWLKKNNLNPTQRAETLSLQDWIRLAKSGIIEA